MRHRAVPPPSSSCRLRGGALAGERNGARVHTRKRMRASGWRKRPGATGERPGTALGSGSRLNPAPSVGDGFPGRRTRAGSGGGKGKAPDLTFKR